MTATRTVKIKSGFAILDVLSEKERFALHKRLEASPIGVIIHGRIIGVHGHHDGTSQEYEVEVDKVDTHEVTL
jgi:hypothetical protein